MKKLFLFILLSIVILVNGCNNKQDVTNEINTDNDIIEQPEEDINKLSEGEAKKIVEDWLYRKYVEACNLDKNCTSGKYKVQVTDIYLSEDKWKVFGYYSYETDQVIIYTYSDGSEERVPLWNTKIFNLFIDGEGNITQRISDQKSEPESLPEFPKDIDLIDYPSPFVINNKFFDTILIVGVDSPASDTLALVDISTYLALSQNKEINDTIIPYSFLDTEVIDSYYDRQIIVISSMRGDRCTNKVVGKFISCKELDLKPGEGFIGYLNNGDKMALLVIGKDSETIRVLGRILGKIGNPVREDSKLMDNPVLIDSFSNITNRDIYSIESW